jgi:hypothetical protein
VSSFNSGESTDPYLGFQSALTVFKMLLGDFDTSVFTFSDSPSIAMVLFVFFMVAMVRRVSLQFDATHCVTRLTDHCTGRSSST